MSSDVTISLVGGQWQCSPDPVVVKGNNVNLKFTLTAAGYSFRATDPIVVQNPGDQFPERSVRKDATTATLKDKNTKKGDFKYSAFVVNDATGQGTEIDPTIRNEL